MFGVTLAALIALGPSPGGSETEVVALLIINDDYKQAHKPEIEQALERGLQEGTDARVLGESEATVRDQATADVILYARVETDGTVWLKNTLDGEAHQLPPEEGIAPADVLAVELGNKIAAYKLNDGETRDEDSPDTESAQIPTGTPQQAGESIRQQPWPPPPPKRFFGDRSVGVGVTAVSLAMVVAGALVLRLDEKCVTAGFAKTQCAPGQEPMDTAFIGGTLVASGTVLGTLFLTGLVVDEVRERRGNARNE
jgi:hypothetical protein